MSRLPLGSSNAVLSSDRDAGNVENGNKGKGLVGGLDGEKPEGRVLVLYTGGTIGMMRNELGALVPVANAFVKNLRRYPQLYDREYAEKRFGAMGPLVLPMSAIDNRRVVYSVLEYSKLNDSSNMNMTDWIRIANDIK
ncbi:hypothetical protein DMN91_011584, partial [Ooceraea biroi]